MVLFSDLFEWERETWRHLPLSHSCCIFLRQAFFPSATMCGSPNLIIWCSVGSPVQFTGWIGFSPRIIQIPFSSVSGFSLRTYSVLVAVFPQISSSSHNYSIHPCLACVWHLVACFAWWPLIQAYFPFLFFLPFIFLFFLRQDFSL